MTVHKPLGETISQDRGRLEFEERVEGRNLIEGGPLRATEGKPTSRAQRTHRGAELRSGKQVARPSGAQEARYLKERTKGHERVPRRRKGETERRARRGTTGSKAPGLN